MRCLGKSLQVRPVVGSEVEGEACQAHGGATGATAGASTAAVPSAQDSAGAGQEGRKEDEEEDEEGGGRVGVLEPTRHEWYYFPDQTREEGLWLGGDGREGGETRAERDRVTERCGWWRNGEMRGADGAEGRAGANDAALG